MEVDYDGNWKPFDESYANLLTNLEISKFKKGLTNEMQWTIMWLRACTISDIGKEKKQ